MAAAVLPVPHAVPSQPLLLSHQEEDSVSRDPGDCLNEKNGVEGMLCVPSASPGSPWDTTLGALNRKKPGSPEVTC